MKILVTGGSGTVGRALIGQLAKTDHDIVAFDLKNSNTLKFYKQYSDKIKTVFGSLAEKDDIDKVGANFDVVLHVGGIIPPVADERPELAQLVNVEGTKALIHKIERDSPNAFFVYASSISIYGDRIENPFIKIGDPLIINRITRKDQASIKDQYAVTKQLAEEAIQTSRLKWSIFRIAAVMGVKNHKLSKLMFEMPLETSLEIISPSDVARAFRNSLDHQEELNGNIYNLGGGDKNRTTYREFLGRNFEVYGLGPFNLPDEAFSVGEFHCGYYDDWQVLDNIVQFQQDTLTDYFKTLEREIPKIQRMATKLVSPLVKRYLLSLSEFHKS